MTLSVINKISNSTKGSYKYFDRCKVIGKKDVSIFQKEHILVKPVGT